MCSMSHGPTSVLLLFPSMLLLLLLLLAVAMVGLLLLPASAACCLRWCLRCCWWRWRWWLLQSATAPRSWSWQLLSAATTPSAFLIPGTAYCSLLEAARSGSLTESLLSSAPGAQTRLCSDPPGVESMFGEVSCCLISTWNSGKLIFHLPVEVGHSELL